MSTSRVWEIRLRHIFDQKGDAAVTGRAAPSHAPREVNVTQPERVQIPAPPTVGRPTSESGNAKRVMPPQPAKERKEQADQEKQKQKEKPKGQQKKEGGD